MNARVCIAYVLKTNVALLDALIVMKYQSLYCAMSFSIHRQPTYIIGSEKNQTNMNVREE